MKRRIGILYCVLALLIVIGQKGISLAAAPATQPEYPLAMCSNGGFWSNKDYPIALLDAGARTVRVDSSFAAARKVAGNDPDKWNWSEYDSLRRLRGKYPELQFLPIFGYCPEWAAEPGAPKGPNSISGRPRGLDVTPTSDPKNLYGHFVYETVRRYKDVCKDWESWNEPDLPGHAFFIGNGKDFFLVQKSCYLSAKAADPTCRVVFAGQCYGTAEGYLKTHNLNAPSPAPPQECFFEDYLKECVKDPDTKANHYYFDVMNQHSYSRASDLYDYAAIDRKLMVDYLGEEGKTKPIWVTEMGFPDKVGLFGGTEEEYADYLLQSFAWGELAGVQKFFHFQLDDSNGLGLYHEVPAKPKPVLVTYRDVLAKELGSMTSIKQLHGNAGVGLVDGNSPYKPTWQTGYNAFEMTAGNGQRRVLMAFADTDKGITVQLPAKAAHATLVDRYNHRKAIDAKDGMYEVKLEGATNVAGWPSTDDPKAKAMGKPEHLVGGATVLIVEVAAPK